MRTSLLFLFALCIGCIYLFIFKLCVYDYAVFKDEGIELHSPFKIKAFFEYGEVVGCFAYYTSVIEKKKYLAFIHKKYNSVVTNIDTSKYGNVIPLNKMKVVYVPMIENLFNFLKEKTDLQWYVKK